MLNLTNGDSLLTKSTLTELKLTHHKMRRFGMHAGKVWGTTELIEANGVLEFHRIEMLKGGVCSKHLHEYKWNGFYVESGKMLVRVWQKDYNLVDETILAAGQYTKVKPGVYHQFECLESGVAFELYWAEFNHNDIKRETVGHRSPT